MGIEYIKRRFEKTLSDESKRILDYIEIKQKELQKEYEIKNYDITIHAYEDNPSKSTLYECIYNIRKGNLHVAIEFFKKIISSIDTQIIEEISDRDSLYPDIAIIFNNELNRRLINNSENTIKRLSELLSRELLERETLLMIIKRIENLIKYILDRTFIGSEKDNVLKLLIYISDKSERLYVHKETKDKVQKKINELSKK
jgi:hypothetical protein